MSARRPSAACTFIPMATPNGGLPRASREAALAAMRQWIEANGRLPAWSEWEYAVDGRHSAKTIDRRWGWDSFRAAAAGVPRRRLHGLKVRAHRLQRSWLDAHRAAATADGPLRARGPVADRQAMGSRDGRTPSRRAHLRATLWRLESGRRGGCPRAQGARCVSPLVLRNRRVEQAVGCPAAQLTGDLMQRPRNGRRVVPRASRAGARTPEVPAINADLRPSQDSAHRSRWSF